MFFFFFVWSLDFSLATPPPPPHTLHIHPWTKRREREISFIRNTHAPSFWSVCIFQALVLEYGVTFSIVTNYLLPLPEALQEPYCDNIVPSSWWCHPETMATTGSPVGPLSIRRGWLKGALLNSVVYIMLTKGQIKPVLSAFECVTLIFLWLIMHWSWI